MTPMAMTQTSRAQRTVTIANPPTTSPTSVNEDRLRLMSLLSTAAHSVLYVAILGTSIYMIFVLEDIRTRLA